MRVLWSADPDLWHRAARAARPHGGSYLRVRCLRQDAGIGRVLVRRALTPFSRGRVRLGKFALDQCRALALSQASVMSNALKNQGAPAANLAAMTDRLGLPTTAAAWPRTLSPLARAIEACQRCDSVEVCNDWLARAPARVASLPAFCPNAEALACAKQNKEK